MINNLSIDFQAFAGCNLTSLSVDEILLPRYVNLSTNLQFNLLLLHSNTWNNLKQMINSQ